MSATTTKLTAVELSPCGLSTNQGYKVGFILSGAKSAQNDKWQVTNAIKVIWGTVTNDSAGTHDSITISGNTITLTGATTGAASGIIVYI